MKWFALLGLLVFLGVAVAPSVNATQSLELDTALRIEHLPYLIHGYTSLKDSEIKLIVRKAINGILMDGTATINEIQSIVEKRKVKLGQIYLLAEVKTTQATDGSAISFPGYVRSFIGRYKVTGAYVNYDHWGWGNKGWYLTINNKVVNRTGGRIIGFCGEIFNFWNYHPPISSPWFQINGTGLIVFHKEE